MSTTASVAALTTLHGFGVRHAFGNPGTMELPLYDELAENGIDLVLALQEIVAVSAAAGYAAASRAPALVIMHTAAGVGNGMGALYNAARMELPLVVVVGTQDSRHLIEEPVLGGDPIEMCESLARWTYRVHDSSEIGPALARAYHAAMTPPRGPAVVAVAMNDLLDVADFEVPAPSELHVGGVATGLERLAEALLDAEKPLLVVGAEVAWEEAVDEAVTLAEALGCPVMSEPVNGWADFPSGHPLYAGVLPAHAGAIRKTMGRHDVVAVLGAPVFRPILYHPARPVPDGVRLFQLDSRAEAVARRYPVELGLVGSMRASLHALRKLVEQSGQGSDGKQAPASTEREVRDELDAGLKVVKSVVDRDVVIVDESSSSSWASRQWLDRDHDNYFACNAGGLGMGPGFAVGAAVARPDRPVLCLLGDGAVMYASQAFWTAAHLGLSVTFLVVNNDGYESLRNGYRSFESRAAAAGSFPGTVLRDPEIDFLALAQSHGVPAQATDDAAELERMLTSALSSPGPALVELRLPSGVKQ